MSERANYLPSPLALWHLRTFGERIYELLGVRAYVVGSALERSDYRDVDVRVMLDDERCERVFGGDGLWVTNGPLQLANMALSALGKQMTGLEVDCQIQRLSDANTEYGGERRHALLAPGIRTEPPEGSRG